eukprot:m.225251 g.225251  ORF g.225251 m.225251 type:complete len:792 (+) comp16652_c0_seq1:17-2392(+)
MAWVRGVLFLALASLCLAASKPAAKVKTPIQFSLPSSGLPTPQAAKAAATPKTTHKRVTRSTDPQPSVSTVELNDLYERGFLHFAGYDSQTALLLTYSNSNHKFDFYRSSDYGSSNWTLNNDLFHANSDISTLAASSVNTSNVMFEESDGTGVWSSNDAAATVTWYPTAFTVQAETLQFSPYMSKLVLVRDINQHMYFSFHLGANWTRLITPQGEPIIVSAFSWGTDTDDCDVIFVQHSNGHVYQVALGDRYPSVYTLLTANISSPQAATFVLDNEYIFVEAFTDTVDVNLYVSVNRSALTKASFPGPPRTLDFIVVDASENMAIVAVQHADNLSNLYISGRHALHFSLSLTNVLLIDRGGVKIVDFQRVLGLEGLYLATQLTPGAEYNQFFQTVMTFNKGGSWSRIEAPDTDDCDLPDCSLNFHMQFSHLNPRMRIPPVYSTPSAPGYLLANGNLGGTLFNGGQAYFSADAGLTWEQSSTTLGQFHMLDSGSVAIIGPANINTLGTSINYSIDDGTTWKTFDLDEPVHVVAMLSRPGNLALDFVVAGVDALIQKWVISTINFAPVLPNACTPDDYFYWSPRDELDGLPCVLGADIHVQRRDPSGFCHNGFNFTRNETSEPCQCTGDDLDCEFGFARAVLGAPCMPITDTLPLNCTAPGQTIQLSHGYRLVADDVCEGGVLPYLQPFTYVCPSYSNTPTEAPATTKPGPDTTTAPTTHTTPAPARSSDSSGHSSAGLIAGLVIAMLLLVLAGVVIFVLLRRRGARAESVRYAPLNASETEDKDRDEDMLAF